MCRVMESSVWTCQQSMCDSQSAVVGPDLLPCANDTTARIHLHRWWDQECWPSLHAIKRGMLDLFQDTNFPQFSIVHIKPQNQIVHYVTLQDCSSCLKTNKEVFIVCNYNLFVPLCSRAQKPFNTVNTCWEVDFICTSALLWVYTVNIPPTLKT